METQNSLSDGRSTTPRYYPLPAGPGRYPSQAQLWANQNALSGGHILLISALHIPLLQIFLLFPFLATAHSIAALLAGLYFLTRDEQPVRLAWAIAYIAGCELLWRGAEAALVWEYGKYATILLCVGMILRYRLIGRQSLWPWLFIALLVPGNFVAGQFDREGISYQLAGPLAIALVTIAFSRLTFTRAQLQRVFLAVIAPSTSVAFLVLISLTAPDALEFGGGANETVTGGIGANQVTSVLSFGATCAYLYAILLTGDSRIRRLMYIIVVGLLVFSVLTFSRAGLWNALGAILAGILVAIHDRRRLFSISAGLVGIAIMTYFFIFPLLLNLTRGEVTERFSDFDSTGRDVLVQIDYEIFLENPIWGVGVGRSPELHEPYFGYPKPTHTEYGRLLAEHGSLGVGALLLLAAMTLSRLTSRRSAASKGISMAFTAWGLLFMVHAATRLVAPSFAIGLAAAQFLIEAEPETDHAG